LSEIMGLKRDSTAVICVLVVAATVGMANLLRGPDEPLHFEKAQADDGLDPDAPIATARYKEPTDAQLAAVGLMRIPDAPPKPAEIAQIDDPPVEPYDMAKLMPPPSPDSLDVQARAAEPPANAFQGPDPEALAALSRQAERGVALAGGQTLSLGKALSAQGQALLQKVAPTESDRRKGRWFAFVAASDKAFGLNLVRDDVSGRLRRAGWSVERLAQYGEAQVGVGWRKYGGQISLSVARREIGDVRVRIRDYVTGISWSWRPQDA
jgi:hypothetical protein